MSNTIQVKRGSSVDLPVLNSAEFGFTTDSTKLYIGDGIVNHQLSMAEDSLGLVSVNSNNISNVVFTLSNGSIIEESFDHVHIDYALKGWVEDNFDKYNSWSFYSESTFRKDIISGDTLDISTTDGIQSSYTLDVLTLSHINAVTADTAEGTATSTLTYEGDFTVPTITYDAQGHITSWSINTLTLPAESTLHEDLTDVTSDQHHNQVHTLIGSDHSDVTITTLATNDILKYNGTSWINVADETGLNYYLTGVSGSGNGTVTFTRNGLTDLTWDASHTHPYNNYVHPNHSGHVTSTGDGATVLTVSGITGQTALTSGLVSTDELLLNDGGVIKRMDVSVLETYMQDNLTFTINSNDYLSSVNADNISNVIFTLGDATTIETSFDHIHVDYALSDWVTDNFEPIIAAGTVDQYWRGDKTWVDFPTAVWQLIGNDVTLIDATANTVRIRTDETLLFGDGGIEHTITYNDTVGHVELAGRSWDFTAELTAILFKMPDNVGTAQTTIYSIGDFANGVDYTDDTQLVTAKAIAAGIATVEPMVYPSGATVGVTIYNGDNTWGTTIDGWSASTSLTGATVLSELVSSNGVITSLSTRSMTASDISAEPALGNPTVDGYLLSSTTAGVRSWSENLWEKQTTAISLTNNSYHLRLITGTDRYLQLGYTDDGTDIYTRAFTIKSPDTYTQNTFNFSGTKPVELQVRDNTTAAYKTTYIRPDEIEIYDVSHTTTKVYLSGYADSYINGGNLIIGGTTPTSTLDIRGSQSWLSGTTYGDNMIATPGTGNVALPIVGDTTNRVYFIAPTSNGNTTSNNGTDTIIILNGGTATNTISHVADSLYYAFCDGTYWYIYTINNK